MFAKLFQYFTVVTIGMPVPSEYDTRGRLNDNYLVVRTPIVESLLRSGRVVVVDETLWGVPESDSILGFCGQIGTSVDLLHKHHVRVEDADDLDDLWRMCDQVEITLTNFYDQDVVVSYRGKPAFFVGFGHKARQHIVSYIGDTFQLSLENGTTLGDIDVRYNMSMTLSPNTFEYLHPMAPENLSARLKEQLAYQQRRADGVKRRFTKHGFAKIRVPENVWAFVDQFYTNNHDVTTSQEDWNYKGFYVNYYNVSRPPELLIPGPEWKSELFRIMIPILEQWIHHTDQLEPQALYGLVHYYKGTVIQDRVERASTHAVSAMINVDQQNMNSPWKMRMRDHSGNVQTIILTRGAMLIYESAACLHGNPEPLNGDRYTSLVVHTRPRGNPRWYEKNIRDEL